MKDRAKRDRTEIDRLLRENQRLQDDLAASNKACRHFIDLARDHGADIRQHRDVVIFDHLLSNYCWSPATEQVGE